MTTGARRNKARQTSTPPPALGELLTPRDVARRLGVTLAGLTDQRYRGRGPAWIKVGRLVRYPSALLDRWLVDHLHQHEQHAD